MASIMIHLAAHEFFHILTPLNLHSEEIHYFDFNDPDMSKHLWLYEGVTEYFSHHNQVRSGLITAEEFLDRMSEKIQNSRNSYDDDLPFTELSRNCLDEHADQYGNVYEKGALIGMCLDLELLRLSNGQQGLIDLMQDLAQTFGSEKPFKDKRLFKEIQKRSHKDIKKFFKTYVDGDTPLPYDYYFRLAGVEYTQPKDTMVYSLGGVQLGYNQETGRVVVAGTYQMNEVGHALGYQNGDEILAVNGKEVPSNVMLINSFLGETMTSLKEGEPREVNVLRKEESGKAQEVRLKTTTRKVFQSFPPEIELMEEPDATKKQLREAWLGE